MPSTPLPNVEYITIALVGAFNVSVMSRRYCQLGFGHGSMALCNRVDPVSVAQGPMVGDSGFARVIPENANVVIPALIRIGTCQQIVNNLRPVCTLCQKFSVVDCVCFFTVCDAFVHVNVPHMNTPVAMLLHSPQISKFCSAPCIASWCF